MNVDGEFLGCHIVDDKTALVLTTLLCGSHCVGPILGRSSLIFTEVLFSMLLQGFPVTYRTGDNLGLT